MKPHNADFWYAYTAEQMRRCDAVLRLPGFSKGGDVEEEEAKRLGIPVFYNMVDLINWINWKRERGGVMPWKEPIIEQCEGCGRIQEWDGGVRYCTPYLNPEAAWRRGRCPMATHAKGEAAQAQKVNPLKQSKREARARRGK